MFQLHCQKQLSEHCWPDRQVIPQLNLLLALEERCFIAGWQPRLQELLGERDGAQQGPRCPL